MKPHENILVIEDDENDGFLLKRTMVKLGIPDRVQIVQDGAEAIAYLSGEGKYADRITFPFPCLIITDLKMPRVDGFAVLKWMKGNPDCSHIPTVVWSSSNHPADVVKAYSLGASCYLKKPIDVSMWGETIGLLFKFWNVCEKPPSK